MKAAVFFPGIGYHCDKPLLYYSRKLAQECGYEETIALSYTYDGGNIRGNEEKMQQAFESLYEQAEKSLSAVDFDKYDEILFVAKRRHDHSIRICRETQHQMPADTIHTIEIHIQFCSQRSHCLYRNFRSMEYCS